jgi:small subunit ribosomal protein S5
MHRLSRARIARIPQNQRLRGSFLLPIHQSTPLRPYSSNISTPELPEVEHTEEQDEDSVSQESFGDNTVPLHYHIPHPDLSRHDPLLDTHVTRVFPPNKKTRFVNKLIVRNIDNQFNSAFETEQDRARESGEDLDGDGENDSEMDSAEVDSKRHLPISPAERDKLFQFPLISRRVTQQTGKGKIHRLYQLTVVGNGDGLVGYGEAKDLDDPNKASDKAFIQAIRNMDYVERFEKRTIFGEMHAKMGSTQIILRPRPVGFGLQCSPKIHQILKAAGIKDISAKVWGSRNPLNVIKALFRVLHSGNAPLYMGDGIGGKGRRSFKGEPIQSREAVERARGRKLLDLRT